MTTRARRPSRPGAGGRRAAAAASATPAPGPQSAEGVPGRPAKEGLSDAPWARVRRVALIRREVREVLSPGAIEVLFDHAELVVEGGEELGGRPAADPRMFATVMVSIDLARCSAQVREPTDEATARRVAELMEAEPRVHQRLRGLAARELARLTGADPEASMVVTLETGIRVEGTVVLIDVDAMATLARRRG